MTIGNGRHALERRAAVWQARCVQSQISLDDALRAELEVLGPRAGATRGTPVESALVLHDDGRVESGVWEVTEGTFPGRKDGVCETFHVLAGAGTVTGDGGEVVVLAPGVTVHQPDGWSGTWDVTTPVRKVYVVVATR